MKFKVVRTSSFTWSEEREIDTLDDLLAFASSTKDGELIIKANPGGLPELEIYDAYRE